MKDLLSSSVAFILNALLNLCTGVLAARLLGPDGRGELAVVMLWPQLVGAVGVALVTDAVVHASAAKSAPYPKIFASAMACGLALSIPLVLAGLAVEAFAYGQYRSEVAAIGRLYLLFIPLTMLTTFAAALFQGSLNFVAWNTLGVFVSVVYLVLNLVFFAADAISVRSFAAASLLANLATLILAVVMLARRGWLGWRPDFAVMKRFLVYGAPIAAGQFLLAFGEKLDQIVISQWRDGRELGLYVVALGMAGPILSLGGMLGALVLPKVAGQSTAQGRAEVLGRYLRLSIVAAGFATLAVAILAPLLVRLLFGAPFAPTATLVQIIMLATIPYIVRRLLIQAFKAHDRTRLVARVELVTVAVSAAALLSFVPWLGVLGAAWAFVLVNAAGTCYALALARQALGLPVRALLRPSTADWLLVRGEAHRLRRLWSER